MPFPNRWTTLFASIFTGWLADDGDDDGATSCCKGDRCFRDAYAATAASLVLSGACAAALAKRTRPLYSAAAAAGQA